MTKEEALQKIEELKLFIKEQNLKEARKFFINSILGCTINVKEESDKNLLFKKNNVLLMTQDTSTGLFYLSYFNIWAKLQTNYNLNYHEVSLLTTNTLKDYFHYQIQTTTILNQS